MLLINQDILSPFGGTTLLVHNQVALFGSLLPFLSIYIPQCPFVSSTNAHLKEDCPQAFGASLAYTKGTQSV